MGGKRVMIVTNRKAYLHETVKDAMRPLVKEYGVSAVYEVISALHALLWEAGYTEEAIKLASAHDNLFE
jgi:hypothetical protein